MPPARFEECLGNARRLADAVAGVTFTLKSLLIDFGERLFPYTDAQRAVLESPPLPPRRPTRAVVRGAMRTFRSDGTSVVWPASRFVVDNSNHWNGWECAAGVELLTIRADGQVFRAACGQGGRIGVGAMSTSSCP